MSYMDNIQNAASVLCALSMSAIGHHRWMGSYQNYFTFVVFMVLNARIVNFMWISLGPGATKTALLFYGVYMLVMYDMLWVTEITSPIQYAITVPALILCMFYTYANWGEAAKSLVRNTRDRIYRISYYTTPEPKTSRLPLYWDDTKIIYPRSV